eukprot:TRINITY_DN6180_c0_g1_i1.p1 TRINITY_DN6180_c0_g1~~TRINITY_DN6180_c0_g1_i1.p1  ORF type:complete len:314 (+),score=93.29 TRINITY_DN6180_c0_g1_i1:54-944(+)
MDEIQKMFARTKYYPIDPDNDEGSLLTGEEKHRIEPPPPSVSHRRHSPHSSSSSLSTSHSSPSVDPEASGYKYDYNNSKSSFHIPAHLDPNNERDRDIINRELRRQNFFDKRNLFDPDYDRKAAGVIVGGTIAGFAATSIPIAGVLLGPAVAGAVTFGGLVKIENDSVKKLGDPRMLDNLLMNDSLYQDDDDVEDFRSTIRRQAPSTVPSNPTPPTPSANNQSIQQQTVREPQDDWAREFFFNDQNTSTPAPNSVSSTSNDTSSFFASFPPSTSSEQTSSTNSQSKRITTLDDLLL